MKFNNFSKITSNILGSRLTGFLRDVLFANYLGANILSDAFLFAYRLPNLFRRIFAEGAVNSVLIPMFIKQKKENEHKAVEFFWSIFLIFLLLTSILSIFIFIFKFDVISVLAPGFTDNKNQFIFAGQLLTITFPFLIFVTLSAILSSILNINGKFFLPSFLSVILNTCMILAIFLFKSNAHFALAWSLIVAGAIQLSLLFINLKSLNLIWKFSINGIISNVHNLKTFLKRLSFSVFGSGIVQLNIFISMIFATLVGEGTISHLYYADRIIDLPFALVAVAISITLLPYLSKNILNEEKNVNAFNQTIIFCLIFSIPSVFGLYYLSHDIVNVLFGRGEFLPSDVLITSDILIVYSLSLPGYMFAKICNQIFFSNERVELPVFASIPTFLLNLILCFFLYQSLGAIGLAIASTTSVWLNVAIQIIFLKKFFFSFYQKIKIIDYAKIVKILFCSTLMLIFIFLIEYFLSINLIIDLFLKIFFGVLVYFLTLKFLNLDEIKLIYKSKKFN
jgi:putative peptidoglycan lipid II flippase